MAVLFVALGVLIVSTTVFDIIATVLHPGLESPFSNRFQRKTPFKVKASVARSKTACQGEP